ncbi:MAG: MerR family transcriptional regulator [Acidimicrobiales bacterium]|nr:MerR family transcriptional regulator [Acidimicrobiales bacterium]
MSSDRVPRRSIGDVLAELQAEFPDISLSKIRYLESQGLLEPARTVSGYRNFSATDIETLRWVLVQQREHFLPLKVIKQRLDQAGGVPLDNAATNGATIPATSTSATRTAQIHPGAGSLSMTLDELCSASGLDAAQIAQLEKYGLIDPVKIRGRAIYDGNAVVVARLAERFAAFGVEARHLRMYKVAAEREAGVLEQAISTLGGKPRAASRDRLQALSSLGTEMRAALLAQLLDTHLD